MDWDEFLHEAIDAKDIDLVRQALAEGADPNRPNSDGNSSFVGTTELFWAVSSGEVEIVRLLLEAGAKVAAEMQAESSSLHTAVEDNARQMINLLLEYDGAVAVNWFDYIDRTPLMCAVENGNVEIARCLIEAGSDVNANNKPHIGNTASHIAAGSGTLEMVELLVCAGADPTIQGWMWIMPLDKAQARKRGEGPRIYEILERAAKRF